MKKLPYIDVAKGICMLLIVFGHYFPYSNSAVMIYINSFHVPAYYIISGFLIEYTNEYNKPLLQLMKSNILRLIVPYICFETIYNIMYCVFHGFSNIGWLQWQTFILYGAGFATWFLPVLFISKSYLLCVRKLTPNKYIVGAACLIPFCIALFSSFSESSGHWKLFIFFRSFNAIGFLWIGTFLHKHINKILNSKVALAVLLLLSPSTALINGLTNTYSMHYHNPILYVASAVAGTLLVLCISKYIGNTKVFTFFSDNSIIVLGTHQPIQFMLTWLIGDQFVMTYWLPLMLLVIALEVPISIFINRFAPFLIGKWYKR